MAEGKKHKKHDTKEISETVPLIPSETLTVDEIVKRYDLHPVTVRIMIRKSVFPNAYREIKGKIRRWLVPVADLENFIPRKKGRGKVDTPTVGSIRSRSERAKKRIKDSHGYGKKEIKEMVELENRGLSRAEIAIRYRLDDGIVADLLDQAALLKPRAQKQPRPKRQIKRLPEKELVELYVNGEFSTAYILEKLNTNYASLYINLRHYGIPLRDEYFRQAAQEKEYMLYRLSIEDELSPDVIADRLNLNVSYVRRKINELKRRLQIMETES